MLSKRALTVRQSRGFFLTGIAFGCVLSLMLCSAALPSGQTSSRRQVSPSKILRCALFDGNDTDKPSLAHAGLAVKHETLDVAQSWAAEFPCIASAASPGTARSIADRSPPFC
jgi:hypothetical protein